MEYLDETPEGVRTLIGRYVVDGGCLDGCIWKTWKLSPAEQYRAMTTREAYHALDVQPATNLFSFVFTN